MRPIIATFALLLVASTAHADEPDQLGVGAIAESCALEFPNDLEAAKACEVVIRIDLRRHRESTLEHHGDMILRLFSQIDERDVRIAELEARVRRLESLVEQQPATPRLTDKLACENTAEYPTRADRSACRSARDAGLNFVPVPK